MALGDAVHYLDVGGFPLPMPAASKRSEGNRGEARSDDETASKQARSRSMYAAYARKREGKAASILRTHWVPADGVASPPADALRMLAGLGRKRQIGVPGTCKEYSMPTS